MYTFHDHNLTIKAKLYISNQKFESSLNLKHIFRQHFTLKCISKISGQGLHPGGDNVETNSFCCDSYGHLYKNKS